MSASNPDPFSSNDAILFEIREVLDRLIDDVDALLTNEAEDFDAAVLSPQEKDGGFLDHAAKCSSCAQVFGMLGDDDVNENDLDWNPDGYELVENSNGDRSLSSSEGSSGSDTSWDEILVALLSIPNNAIEDEGFEDDDAIDVVQWNASNEEDVGDRDFDVLEGSDTSWDDILVALLSIPNNGVENDGFEDDDASSEEEVGVVMDVVQWDDVSNEEVVGDAEDFVDAEDFGDPDIDYLDVLMMFFAEPEDEEQRQLGSGDHPQEGGGNVLDEMD